MVTKFISYLLILSIIIVILLGGFYFFIANPWSPIPYLFQKREYTADSIQQLKKEISTDLFGNKSITENWDKLEIAGKLDNVEEVVFSYRPQRADIGSLINAKIKFNKDILSEDELKGLFNKALINAGFTPFTDDPGVYCFKRNSSGYFKTDVLVIRSHQDSSYMSSSFDNYPTRYASLEMFGGDSWKSCKKLFGL